MGKSNHQCDLILVGSKDRFTGIPIVFFKGKCICNERHKHGFDGINLNTQSICWGDPRELTSALGYVKSDVKH